MQLFDLGINFFRTILSVNHSKIAKKCSYYATKKELFPRHCNKETVCKELVFSVCVLIKTRDTTFYCNFKKPCS